MPSQTVFQQYRRVATNAFEGEAGGTVADLHMDIEVKQPKEKSLKATCKVWNVKREHWQQLSKGDPFFVTLGYLRGPRERVIRGTVEEKKPPQSDGADTVYEFNGPDEADKLLKSTSWSHTWQAPPVSRVVRDIAGEANIGVEQVDASGATLDRRYPISKQQNLGHWLDKLVEEADELTSTQHRWFCRAGRLSFVPKDTPPQEAVVLRDGEQGNLMKIDAAEGKGKKTDGSDNLEIEMILDPRVRKGGLARVQSEKYSGNYKFQEYTMTSSTDSGDHNITATLAPTDAQWRKLPDSRQRQALGRV